MNIMNLEEYKGVYVFAEQVDNKLSGIAFELLGKAKDLAADLNAEVAAVLIGSDVKGLADELETRGILLRRCENYSGLGPDWFRLGLKKREDNNILLKAMKEVL